LPRRRFLLSVAAALAPSVVFARHIGAQDHVRIGLTPVFLDDQVAFLNRWREYLEANLQKPVDFVQRGSYREVVDLLREDKLDYAWLCGYPFVRHRKELQLLAVPLFNGKPLYQSYLIVPSADRETRSILDLRGKVFAFSDPDSNSGFLFPNYRLLQLKERPDAFFRKSFFAWAHRKVVEAVGTRLAQGGAVDGYVWETLDKFYPELTAKTRIVEKSPEFGHPPFVARTAGRTADFLAAQRTLVQMSNDATGRALLKQLNLDGFTVGDVALFDGIAHMARVVRGGNHAAV
jgi:phosphonate transport system substrate-binding protein